MSLNQSNSQQFPLPQFSAGPAVIDVAMGYVAAGISVIPIACNGSKAPAWWLLPKVVNEWGVLKHSWRPYMARFPTPDELRAWYTTFGSLSGIGVVGGAISGGLEVLDFDSLDLADPWMEAVSEQNNGLLNKLVFVLSPRPGLHLYFRSPACEPNQKLAQRLEVNPENRNLEIKTLIETRGQGGYALTVGSPGFCHPSGRQYTYLREQNLTQIATITAEERQLLFSTARSFDHIERRPPTPPRTNARARPSNLALPGDAYNCSADWGEILVRHGWTFVSAAADGVQLWRRPGKASGVSATVNYAGNDLLHVFSTNAPHLEDGCSYSKFAFVTAVEHGGDFRAAAQALRAAGFGRQQLPAGRRRRRPGRSSGQRRNRQRRRRRR